MTSGRAADVRLRWSTQEDDGVCGELVGRALSEAPYRRHIRRALVRINDAAPLPLPPHHFRIVACTADRVVAMAQFAPMAGYLKYLFVDPAHQRQRIGGRLLREVEHHVAMPLRLSVLAVNKDGLAFYRRAGFQILRRERDPDWYGQRVTWIELVKGARPSGPDQGGTRDGQAVSDGAPSA